jgi:hypothetical protein
VISLSAHKVIERVFNAHKVIGTTSSAMMGGGGLVTVDVEHMADYGVIIVDDREYWRNLADGLLYGNFIRNNNKWRFYKAYELDLPTMQEINNFKALIVWSSTSTPSFKENSDGTPPPWVRPVIKLIKAAYHKVPHLKIMGYSLG